MITDEELRRMLDEAGEYYKTSGNRTWWGRPIDMQTGKTINVFHYQAQPMGEDRLFVELQLATPAQAIATTLGRGECHDKGNIERFICSECGCRLALQDDEWEATMWLADGAAMVPRFCPNCGRKVDE